MSKIFSFTEYEDRIKSIRTPEEAAAFAREIMLANAEDGGLEDRADSKEAAEHSIKNQVHSVESEIPSPWYDLVANDNEAMVVDLYSKGMATRDIASYMKMHHGMELSQPDVSSITDKIYPLVKEWQARALSSIYPIIYLDGLRFRVRDSGKVISKVGYIVLGLNQYGEKEILGIWTSSTESARFWMQILTELRNRGVEDIFIACVDGLRGFPEAIRAVFPQTDVQVCVVHQIRHTVMFLPQQDQKIFCKELRDVYTAINEEVGMAALTKMMERWPQYKSYLKRWENRWSDLVSFFGYPDPIRNMIYSTNAIENLNRQFRRVTKTTIIFPHDDALMKLLWLAQVDITQRWNRPVRRWGEVMAQLAVLFPDRVQF